MWTMRAIALLGVGMVMATVASDTAFAHALARRYDLPLPLGYFILGAGAAVALSFGVMALKGNVRGRPARLRRGGAITAPLVAVCQTVSVAGLLLVVAAGLFGAQNTFKNVAPVAVWVIGWIGLSFVSAFVGNVWNLFNPWTALFDATVFLWRGSTADGSRFAYPRWLGAWPACALFFVFAWLELVAPARDVPFNIAVALILYSAFTLAAFALFGRDVWLRNAEVFTVVFALFARFAPLRIARGRVWRWRLRPYAAGLVATTPLTPSMIAFTILVLATVTADGIMETPFWVTTVENFAGGGDTEVSAGTYRALQTVLLATTPLVLAAAYLSAVSVMARISGARADRLAGLFVLSLVPIAIGYHLAHYFSLIAIAGQFIIPLVSDPFGYGWDLFGTSLYRIDIGVVDARSVWYLALVAIVTGHIIAVWLGHRATLRELGAGGASLRSQFPLLALMVGYTMLSLWILAQPIVEPAVS